MEDLIKKLILALVAAFVIFYLITEPSRSADVVEGAIGAAGTGISRIGTFFHDVAT